MYLQKLIVFYLKTKYFIAIIDVIVMKLNVFIF